MFSRLLQASVRAGAQRVARATRLVGLSPNALTLIGLAIACAAAVLAGLNNQLWAGVVLLVAGAFDLLDGAVARVSGRMQKYGAFLDSTADRYGEGVIYLGLLYLFLFHLHQELGGLLIGVAMLGSLLVSYVRARAQSLGFTCDAGWFARPERVVVTAAGLIIGQMLIAVWILAIATNLTALQRIWEVWKQHRAQLQRADAGEGEEDPERPKPPAGKSRRGAAPSSPGAL